MKYCKTCSFSPLHTHLYVNLTITIRHWPVFWTVSEHFILFNAIEMGANEQFWQKMHWITIFFSWMKIEISQNFLFFRDTDTNVLKSWLIGAGNFWNSYTQKPTVSTSSIDQFSSYLSRISLKWNFRKVSPYLKRHLNDNLQRKKLITAVTNRWVCLYVCTYLKGHLKWLKILSELEL